MHPRILGTLVYAIRDDEVLLHRRVKAPNVGRWVAPGGKLEWDESPLECAMREMREETGLTVEDPQLRGIMTEVSPRADYQWLTFIFAATRFTGELAPPSGIGEFRWWRIAEVFEQDIPATDRVFFPRVLGLADPPFLLKFTYDAELRITRIDES